RPPCIAPASPVELPRRAGHGIRKNEVRFEGAGECPRAARWRNGDGAPLPLLHPDLLVDPLADHRQRLPIPTDLLPLHRDRDPALRRCARNLARRQTYLSLSSLSPGRFRSTAGAAPQRE